MKFLFCISLLFLGNSLSFAQKAVKLKIDGLSVTIPTTNVAKTANANPELNAILINEVTVMDGQYSIAIYPLDVAEQNDSTAMAKSVMVENMVFDENAPTSTMLLKRQIYLTKTSNWSEIAKDEVVVKQLKTFLKDQLYVIYVWGKPADMAKEVNVQQILSWIKFSKFTKI